MRTKNRGGKRRIFDSLPSSNPSLISDPPLYKDDANEQCHVDSSIHGASEDSGTSQDNNCINCNDDADSNNENSDDADSDNDNSDDSNNNEFDDAGDATAATVEEVNNDDSDDAEAAAATEEERTNDGFSNHGGGDNHGVVVPNSFEVDRCAEETYAAESSEHCIVNGDGIYNHGDHDNILVPDSMEEVDRYAAENHAAEPDFMEEVDRHAEENHASEPDSMEELDRHAAENHAAEPSEHGTIVLDWVEREFCIKCNRGKGQVLVCTESGCPVAVHEVCMKSKPRLDDMGKFYCPYCWYKRELARAKELRREALSAKTKLSNFICLNRDGGNEKQDDKTANMKAASESVMARKINTGDCENGPNNDDNEIIHEKHGVTADVEAISEENSDLKRNDMAERFEKFGDSERIEEEDIEDSSNSLDEFGKVQWKVQPIGKETSDVVGVFEENLGKRGKEEPQLPDAVGTSMAPRTSSATLKVRAIESFDFVAPDLDTERPQVSEKRVKRLARRTWLKEVDTPKLPSLKTYNGAENKKVNQKRKVTAAENSVQCQESLKQLNLTLGAQKRRRLYWKPEEEDILKEGVRRYSTKMNKNIPWKKILEFGHHIFDPTRTPADLKDKWKNIMAKGY